MVWMRKREQQPEGNYYDKYHTKNRIEKWLVRHFFRSCGQVLGQIQIENGTILEAGCGEGYFTKFLYEKYKGHAKLEAFDISRACVEQAKAACPGACFRVGSIYEIPKGQKFDLVVASEVLEHMEDPERALGQLLGVCGRYLLVTVPNEPLWRILNMARGKYWRRLGNTPGHVQHWNKKTLRKLILGRGGGKTEVVKAASACPWLILLVRVRQ